MNGNEMTGVDGLELISLEVKVEHTLIMGSMVIKI
jgi:hypothetical protein